MKILTKTHKATISNGEVAVLEVLDVNFTPEELPIELRSQGEDSMGDYIKKIAGYVAKENAKTKAIQKKINKEGKAFKIKIKYLTNE